MQCERLVSLAKNWFTHVKDETMAPARMIQFIKDHVNTCETCQDDVLLQSEIEKITEMILPDSKIPKAVRLQQEQDDEDEYEDDEDVESEDEETTEEEIEEEEEEYINDDDDIEDDDLKELD